MKKIIAAILAFISVLSLFGCKGGEDSSSTSSGPEKPTYEYVSIFKDKTFKRGFGVRGLGKSIYGDEIERFDGESTGHQVDFQYEKEADKKPVWQIHQWATRYPFHDVNNTATEVKNGEETFNYRFTDLGSGSYLYENTSKTVKVNTETGEVSLGLKASECYKEPRVQGQEWPHLLLTQEILASDSRPELSIKNSSSLKVKVDLKVDEFTDHMENSADAGIHSAVCMLYLYVSYKKPNSMGYSDMIWFGLTLFDNRIAFAPGMSGLDEGTKDSATGKWIYNIPATEYYDMDNNLYGIDGKVALNQWASVDLEVLPFIEVALADAQRGGCMKGATLDDLYINGMYLGFEIPGTYDLGMTFKNLDVINYIEV